MLNLIDGLMKVIPFLFFAFWFGLYALVAALFLKVVFARLMDRVRSWRRCR